MYLNLCHIRFPYTLRFVLQLHILLLLIQIGLNSPIKKGSGNNRQKRDQEAPNNLPEILKKSPTSLEEDNNVLPSPQKNEIDKYNKQNTFEGGPIARKLMDANRSVNRKVIKGSSHKKHNKVDIAKWKKRLPKKEKNEYDDEIDISMMKRKHKKWMRAQEEKKVFPQYLKSQSQNGFTIRHISRVPQPSYKVDNAPEGLAEDQNRHGDDDDDDYEETFSTQREAFEKMLDEHRKHPRRTKESQEDKYIILSYDYKNKKYSIVEIEDDDDDSRNRNKHKHK